MYESLTKITIVLCWLSLFSFWAIKLFGGNWFEIIVSNENFVKFSDLVQNTWLKYLVSFFTIFFARYFIFCAICQKFTFKGGELIVMILFIISVWFVANFGNFQPIQATYVYIVMAVIGIVYHKSWKRLYGILAIALEFVFTTISMLVRNIPIHILDDYLITFILIIDVNIMIVLYYLYSNLLRIRKESTK